MPVLGERGRCGPLPDTFLTTNRFRKDGYFLIPILSKLMGRARQLAAPRSTPARYNPQTDRVRAEPLVLVVCPTRELACQIFDEALR